MINPAGWMIPVLAAAAEQRQLAPFRAAGATAPDRAIPLAVDDAARGAHFESLLRRGVIVQAGPGRFYLDEAALARRRPEWPAVAAVVFVLIVFALIALLALQLD